MVWKYLFGEEQEGDTPVNLKNPEKGEVKGVASTMFGDFTMPTKSDDDGVPAPPHKDEKPEAPAPSLVLTDDEEEKEPKKKDGAPLRKNFWDEDGGENAPTLNTDLIGSREKEVTPANLRKEEPADLGMLKDFDSKSEDKAEKKESKLDLASSVAAGMVDMDSEDMKDEKRAKSKESKDSAKNEPAALTMKEVKIESGNAKEDKAPSMEDKGAMNLGSFTDATTPDISSLESKIAARKEEEQNALNKLENDLKEIQDKISARKAALAELDQLQPQIEEAKKRREEIEAEQTRIRQEQEEADKQLAELQSKLSGGSKSDNFNIL